MRTWVAVATLLAGGAVAAGEPQASDRTAAQAAARAQRVYPAISHSRPPIYPVEARHFGQQGRVVVRALVDAQGQVAHVEVRESSGHALLDQAALATVRGWSFTPGTRNGTPEAMWARIPINFSLEGKAGR